jgi:hypothetical protein
MAEQTNKNQKQQESVERREAPRQQPAVPSQSAAPSSQPDAMKTVAEIRRSSAAVPRAGGPVTRQTTAAAKTAAVPTERPPTAVPSTSAAPPAGPSATVPLDHPPAARVDEESASDFSFKQAAEAVVVATDVLIDERREAVNAEADLEQRRERSGEQEEVPTMSLSLAPPPLPESIRWRGNALCPPEIRDRERQAPSAAHVVVVVVVEEIQVVPQAERQLAIICSPQQVAVDVPAMFRDAFEQGVEAAKAEMHRIMQDQHAQEAMRARQEPAQGGEDAMRKKHRMTGDGNQEENQDERHQHRSPYETPRARIPHSSVRHELMPRVESPSSYRTAQEEHTPQPEEEELPEFTFNQRIRDEQPDEDQQRYEQREQHHLQPRTDREVFEISSSSRKDRRRRQQKAIRASLVGVNASRRDRQRMPSAQPQQQHRGQDQDDAFQRPASRGRDDQRQQQNPRMEEQPQPQSQWRFKQNNGRDVERHLPLASLLRASSTTALKDVPQWDGSKGLVSFESFKRQIIAYSLLNTATMRDLEGEVFAIAIASRAATEEKLGQGRDRRATLSNIPTSASTERSQLENLLEDSDDEKENGQGRNRAVMRQQGRVTLSLMEAFLMVAAAHYGIPRPEEYTIWTERTKQGQVNELFPAVSKGEDPVEFLLRCMTTKELFLQHNPAKMPDPMMQSDLTNVYIKGSSAQQPRIEQFLRERSRREEEIPQLAALAKKLRSMEQFDASSRADALKTARAERSRGSIQPKQGTLPTQAGAQHQNPPAGFAPPMQRGQGYRGGRQDQRRQQERDPRDEHQGYQNPPQMQQQSQYYPPTMGQYTGEQHQQQSSGPYPHFQAERGHHGQQNSGPYNHQQSSGMQQMGGTPQSQGQRYQGPSPPSQWMPAGGRPGQDQSQQHPQRAAAAGTSQPQGQQYQRPAQQPRQSYPPQQQQGRRVGAATDHRSQPDGFLGRNDKGSSQDARRWEGSQASEEAGHPVVGATSLAGAAIRALKASSSKDSVSTRPGQRSSALSNVAGPT